MAETVSFKVWLRNFGDNGDSDVRRFAMDSTVSRSFSSLLEKLCVVYPILNNKMFTVTWTDEDKDSVTISSDEELTIALAEMTGPVHKLNVQVKGDKEKTRRSTDGDVHPGVMCDGCEKAVAGFRYKCLVCQDFDLCGVCEGKGLHPEHKIMRIASPGQKSFPNMGRRNACRRPCHGPMPGVFGFLEGLDKIAPGIYPRSEEKSCKETKSGEKDSKNTTEKEEETKPCEEVRKESETNYQERKENGTTKSPTVEMINDLLGAASERFGNDFNVPSEDIENVGKLVSDIMSMFNVEKNGPEDKTQELPSEPKNDVESEREKTKTYTPVEEEWTIVQDAHNKSSLTLGNLYPSLDEVAPHSSPDASTSPNTASPPTTIPSAPAHDSSISSSIYATSPSIPSAPAPADFSNTALPSTISPSIPSAPADVTDPKIQVALQAMTNMGFTNEGRWLENLLETKGGDIGKVLDVLKPSNN